GCLRRRNDCRISLATTAKIRPRRCYNCRGLCDIVCTVLPDVRRHRLECYREAAGDLGICLGTTHCRLLQTAAPVISPLPISVRGLATTSSTTHEHRHCCAKIAARGKTKRFDRGQSLELRRLV